MRQHNITSVEYRTYGLSATSDYQLQPNPTVIQDAEALLRNRRCIAHFDTSRRIIWHFGISGKDDGTPSGAGGPALPDDLDIQGVTLSPADSGSFEPASLSRSRVANQGSSTPTGAIPGPSDSSQQQKSASVFSPSSASSSAGGAAGQDIKSPMDLMAVSEALTIDDAYENFVLALLGTLLSDLVKRTGAIPLDNRTVLLTRGQQLADTQDGLASTTPAAAAFRVYLTPMGSLVVGLALYPADGFLSLDKPQLLLPAPPLTDTRTLVAPFGVRAFYQGAPDVTFPHLENGAAQTPDTQVSRFRESRSSPWRQVCTRLLERKGLSAHVLDSTPWITIKIPRQKYLDQRQEGKPPIAINTTIAISWPACLCFRKQHASLPPVSRVGGNTLVGHTESYDPLTSAKAWFQETPERDEALAKRKRERDMVTTQNAVPDPDDPARQQVNSNSPLALQRAGNVAAAAAGVMYPTPPDGVPNPNVPTPSIDAPISSPQQPPPTVSIVDADIAMANPPPLSDELVDRERNEAPYLGDSDNPFDDLGGDMFNDNELTDADFNFFDEPAVSTEVRMEDVAPEVQPNGLQAAPPEPSQEPEHPPPPAPSTTWATTDAPGDAVTEEPVIKRESPVFAKPELRHARSSLRDDAKSVSKSGNGTNSGRAKREHSPFDPDTVFKRVRTALYNPQRSTRPAPVRRRSAYDTVEFDRVLNPVNSKYVDGGKFAVNWEPAKDALNSKKSPPTTDYLKHHGKHHKGPNGLPENHSALIARITSGLESSSIQHSPMKLDIAMGDADDSSPVSDQDDSSVSSEDAFSPVKSAGPRRANFEDDVVSQATSLRDAEMAEESDPSFALELPRLGKAGAADVPVHKFFADPEPLALQLSLPDEDLIAVAQVLTEQAALGSLEIPSDSPTHKPSPTTPDRRRQLAVMTRQTLRTLQDSLSGYLDGATECPLKTFAEIQGGATPPGPPPRTALQPRPVPGRDPEAMKPPVMYQIPSPHLEVKRADSRLSVLPSAVSFWESLGLSPSLGPKNVQAACVFPGWDGMTDNIGLFLDRVKTVYESMKLGSFERLPSAADISDGIVRYDVDKISVTPGHVFPRISSALAERTELLCQALRASAASEKNFVVYFVYSPTNPSSIVEACTSFHQLSEAFGSPMSGKKAPQNELVLQLVPLDFVSAPSSVVIQPPSELARLCLETYDRCAVAGGPMPAPSIALEQVAPRYIDFSLSSTPSPSVIHENSCIHVAYSRSVDGRWVTAAWSDSRGRQQMMASYCLGRKGRAPATPFTDVAHEIWEATHDLISVWRVHWRVVVTKCGTMDGPEMEFWTGLAQTEAKARVSLVLLAVDTSPSMQLLPPAPKTNTAVSATFYSTPASTPQPSILSPEQSGNPPTPSAPTPGDQPHPDAPSDGILIDTLDQSWGCVLSHRLPTSTSPAPLSRSLSSGYLLKRGGTRPEDPPALMEVSVLHGDGGPRQHEALLREMLGHFRALGTLARARGVVGDADVRPWHVAAAEKGVRALYLLM